MENGKIIVNADDFGLSESSAKAIAEAFDKNFISSTTALANGDYIEKAFLLAKEGGFLDKIGVHLNLTEGAPLTKRIAGDPFFCIGGVFHGKIDRLKKPTDVQLSEIEEELSAQIERLLDIGFTLTHADSHHHIHTDLFFIGAFEEVLRKYGIGKIRLHRNFGKINVAKRIVKSAYNAKLRRDGFLTVEKMGSLEDLALFPSVAKDCFCEIMVHPDYDATGVLIDRTEFVSGVPAGLPLSDICPLIGGAKLVSYGELK